MRKRKGKTLRGRLARLLCGALTLLLLLLAGTNAWVLLSTRSRVLSPAAIEETGREYEAILILGAGIWGHAPSPMLQDRLDAGITLYKAGVAPRLLMSGDDSGPSHNEVQVMKDYATSRGVPADAIFMDHAGFSTYESAMRAKEVFHARKLVLVSQAYHLYRALYLADSVGIEAVGCRAAPRIFRHELYYQTREALARTKDFFYGLLKPPFYRPGEPVNLAGSGAVTDNG